MRYAEYYEGEFGTWGCIAIAIENGGENELLRWAGGAIVGACVGDDFQEVEKELSGSQEVKLSTRRNTH